MGLLGKMYRWTLPKEAKVVSTDAVQQWNTYSCGAQAYRMIVAHFEGRAVPYEEAAKAVKLTRDGAYDDDILQALDNAGFEVEELPLDGDSFDEALDQGKLILTDRPTLINMGECTHAIVISGYTPNAYVILDSTLGVYTRPWEKVIENTTAAWSCWKRA